MATFKGIVKGNRIDIFVLWVKSKRSLRVVNCDKDSNIFKSTINVVYKEVTQGL